MALTTDKFLLPNGAPAAGEQAVQSSTYGNADLDRSVGGIGWASYVDSAATSGSPLELNAGNSYVAPITIDGLASGSSSAQWPAGVSAPWDTSTNKLIGVNDGDMFDMRLKFSAQDGASMTLLDIYIDIGGAIGELWRKSIQIAKGASTETEVLISSNYFTGTTFIANGGIIYASTAQSSTDMDIWGIEIVLLRKYVGR
jgi:hypothetical protein